MMTTPITRRTLVKGAAWTAPAIIAVGAAPFAAASVCHTIKSKSSLWYESTATNTGNNYSRIWVHGIFESFGEFASPSKLTLAPVAQVRYSNGEKAKFTLDIAEDRLTGVQTTATEVERSKTSDDSTWNLDNYLRYVSTDTVYALPFTFHISLTITDKFGKECEYELTLTNIVDPVGKRVASASSPSAQSATPSASTVSTTTTKATVTPTSSPTRSMTTTAPAPSPTASPAATPSPAPSAAASPAIVVNP